MGGGVQVCSTIFGSLKEILKLIRINFYLDKILHPPATIDRLLLRFRYYYNAVARTLCPPNITELARHENDTSYDVPISIYIEFSTSSKEMVNFKVKASLMVDFLLR